jgi:tRNA U34 5-methylaminomethyl-2-thiouridine-forming methyltransferase MnmC
MRLLGIHNLWHYGALMRRMREAILAGRWADEYRSLRDRLAPRSAKPRSVGVRRGDFELVTLKSGARTVRHLGHGEVMHPVGPWEEANRLYVDQLELERRLSERGEEPVRILDVGLGAGTNAVAALTRALAMGDARVRDLEVVSLEVDTTPLELALGDAQGFAFLAPWRAAAEALLHEGRWDAPSLSWRLLRGDGAALVEELDGRFDLVFFDPFSPQANPSLWTIRVLRSIRSRMRREGGVLATYSAATPTRVSLLLAGFFVGAGIPTGTKQETTVAASHLELLKEPLGERWLERWERSSAKAPHGLELTPELEAELRAHEQWKKVSRLAAGPQGAG